MKKSRGLGLIFIFVIFSALILLYLNIIKSTQTAPLVSQEIEGAITVEDEMGRKVTFSSIPKRIVVLSGYPAEVLCALHAGDRIVGICNPKNEDLPELRGKQSVGISSTNPDIEKILDLRPDLVIAYQYTKKENIDRLEKLNIPVLCFRAWTFTELQFFAKQMGKMLHEEERAQELWRFIQTRMAMIEERTKNLPLEKKPQLFYESVFPYQTISVGKKPMETAWGSFMAENVEDAKIDFAGGINCVGVQTSASSTLSAEWVLEKNPDVIIKVRRVTDPSGIRSSEDLQNVREEVIRREGLKNIKAVKNGRVFVIHSKMCAGPREIISLCYYAKWLHPELFSDLDPKSIHEEMLEKFWGLKLKGTWGYPD